MLFRTIGLEQNLYEPNVVVNRVAFLVFGLIPGEVVLDGTFEAMTEDLADPNAQPAAEEEEETTETRDGAGGTDTSPGEGESTPPNDAEGGGGGEKEKEKEKAYEREVVVKKGYGVDDGMTVRAFFAPPKIKFGGFPAFSVGPKSSVVLSTTYLDERIRLGRGSRGSLFVFTRKTREDAERDRKRWAVGGLGVTVFLAATLGFFVVAWRRFTAGGVTELSVATAVAVVVSFAMALVMRQGGDHRRGRGLRREVRHRRRESRGDGASSTSGERGRVTTACARGIILLVPRGGSLRQLKSTTSSSSMS